FGGPDAVLAYLSRYTHRVAISNRRLIAANASGVTFKYKDYRMKGPGRYKTMTLATHEFIRRFLIHVLPKGFHRIRHYGLFAGSYRAETIEDVRKLLNFAPPAADASAKLSRQAKLTRHSRSPTRALLRRPHVRHRDFRARLPATPPANRASHGRQDRYLMSASTISRIIICVFRAGHRPAKLLRGLGEAPHCI